MNENAKKWINALRDGKYKQGRNCLRIGDKFCCLGVACDLYARAHHETWVREYAGSYYKFDGAADYLPPKVAEWLGLTNQVGGFGYDNSPAQSLARLNDEGASFKVIAEMIESEPKGLFNE